MKQIPGFPNSESVNKLFLELSQVCCLRVSSFAAGCLTDRDVITFQRKALDLYGLEKIRDLVPGLVEDPRPWISREPHGEAERRY